MHILTSMAMALGVPVRVPEEGLPLPMNGQAPFEVNTGPPCPGAPPLIEAAGVQKEVQANEQTPQAELLDLLDEIIALDSDGGPIRKDRPNATSDLAGHIGDIKAEFDKVDFSRVLGALGIQIPITLQDIRQFRTEIAGKIVSAGLPPNLRGLLSKFLHLTEPVEATIEPIGPIVGAGGDEDISEVPNLADAPVVADDPLSLVVVVTPETIEPSLALEIDLETKPIEHVQVGRRIFDRESERVEDVPRQAPLRIHQRLIDRLAQIQAKEAFYQDRPGLALGLHEPEPKPMSLGRPETAPSPGLALGRPDFVTPRPLAPPILGRHEIEFNHANLYAIFAAPGSDKSRIGRVLADLNFVDLDISDIALSLPKIATGLPPAAPIVEITQATPPPVVETLRPVAIEETAIDAFNEDWPFVKKEVRRQPQVILDSTSDLTKPTNASKESKAIASDAKHQDRLHESKEVEISGSKDAAVTIGDQNPKPIAIKSPQSDATIETEILVTDDPKSIKPEVSLGQTIRTAVHEPTRESSRVLAHTQVAAIHERVIETIQEMMASKGNGRTIIRLHPEEMGSITVEVRSNGQHVDARVSASDDRVRTALNNQRPDLVQSVESRGLNLDSFSVSKESDNPFGRGQNQNQAARQDFERAVVLSGHRNDTPTVAAGPRNDVTFRKGGLDTLA